MIGKNIILIIVSFFKDKQEIQDLLIHKKNIIFALTRADEKTQIMKISKTSLMEKKTKQRAIEK